MILFVLFDFVGVFSLRAGSKDSYDSFGFS